MISSTNNLGLFEIKTQDGAKTCYSNDDNATIFLAEQNVSFISNTFKIKYYTANIFLLEFKGTDTNGITL